MKPQHLSLLAMIILAFTFSQPILASHFEIGEKRLFKCLLHTMESRRHNQETIDTLSQLVERAQNRLQSDPHIAGECRQNLKKMRSLRKISNSSIQNLLFESSKKYSSSSLIAEIIGSKSCVIVGFKAGASGVIGTGLGAGGGICKTKLGRKILVVDRSIALGWGIGSWVALTLDNDKNLDNNEAPVSDLIVLGVGPVVLLETDTDQVKGIGAGVGFADISYLRGMANLISVGIDFQPIRNLLNR